MKFLIDDILIEERPTGQGFYGEYVWPAGIIMCNFLKRNPDVVKGKRVLELGSGTGITGLYAARLGAEHVTLTDFVDWNIETIKINIKKNHLSHKTEPRWFKWGTSLREKWDVIIGSDITYPTMDFQGLMDAVRLHLKPMGRCILSHYVRDSFVFGPEFQMIEEHDFTDTSDFSDLVQKNCTSLKIQIVDFKQTPVLQSTERANASFLS